MKDHYDFSNAIRNPYAKMLKETLAIDVDKETLKMFRQESEKTGRSVESLISSFLYLNSNEETISLLG